MPFIEPDTDSEDEERLRAFRKHLLVTTNAAAARAYPTQTRTKKLLNVQPVQMVDPSLLEVPGSSSSRKGATETLLSSQVRLTEYHEAASTKN